MAEMLQGDVDLPVAGKTKKWVVYGVGGAAVAYVVWRYYAATRAADDAPPGSDGLYSSDLSEFGLSTTGGPTNITGNTGSTNTDGTNPGAIDDNSEWSETAADRLSNAGYDRAVVYAALGEFLDRRALDKSEATIVRAALAAAGQPPEGRPWSVLEESGTGTGTLPAPTNVRQWEPPTPSVLAIQWDQVDGAAYYRIFRGDLGDEPIGASSDTKFRAKGLTANKGYSLYVRAVGTTGKIGGKSNVIGLRTSAVKLARPGGLKSSHVTKTSFRVTCGVVAGAQGYRWYLNGRPYGASDKPYRDFTSLRANTSYRVTVAADTPTQEPGPVSGALTVKTKK